MDNQSSNQLLIKRRAFSMPGIHPVLHAILAVVLAVQMIRLFWIVVTPMGPVGDWQAAQVQVLSPQARTILFNNFDPFYRGAPTASVNIVTSLQLTLYGIRMNTGSGLGSAILAGPDGVQKSYPVGQEIMPGVTLYAVHFDHVVIDRGGIRESLYLDQSVPAKIVGDNIDSGAVIDTENRADESAEDTDNDDETPAI
ncbi:type II secretion system protein N [Parasphingorhabdus sp. JC815]|uniref:type II secretion system protein N n=1 Tax=Parasphingorhabdus sp. JC815 TaxID=3232140 RepID=UPI00345942F5